MCRLCYWCRLRRWTPGPPATLLHRLLALSSPLNAELVIPMTFVCNLRSSLSLRFGNEVTRAFTGESNGVTSLWHTVRLVLRSSFISSPQFIYALLHTDFRLPISIFPLFLPLFAFLFQVHRTLLSYFWYSY